jgi:hypothetical protein
MDGFQRIAQVFKEDCVVKMKSLNDIRLVVKSSDTIGTALRILLIDPVINPGVYIRIQTLSNEIRRLEKCIDSIEVMITVILLLLLLM